jgi:hypothetical protein
VLYPIRRHMKAASTSPSLEERIRVARAERDIAIGYISARP